MSQTPAERLKEFEKGHAVASALYATGPRHDGIEGILQFMAAVLAFAREQFEDAERWRFLEAQHETINDDAHNSGDSSDEWYVMHGYDSVPCAEGELAAAIDAARARTADGGQTKGG